MASTAKLFGAALLNALGHGVKGYGEGTKAYRDYALDQLKTEAALVPTMARNVAWYEKQPVERQQMALDLNTASAGQTVLARPQGGISKIPAPPQPTPRQDTPTDKAKTRMQELMMIPKDQRTPEQSKELGALMTIY